MLKDSHASADMMLTSGFLFSLLPLSSQSVRGNRMQRIRCPAHLDVFSCFENVYARSTYLKLEYFFSLQV